MVVAELDEGEAEVDGGPRGGLAALGVGFLVEGELDGGAFVDVEARGVARAEARGEPAPGADLEVVVGDDAADGELDEVAREVGAAHPEDAAVVVVEAELAALCGVEARPRHGTRPERDAVRVAELDEELLAVLAGLEDAVGVSRLEAEGAELGLGGVVVGGDEGRGADGESRRLERVERREELERGLGVVGEGEARAAEHLAGGAAVADEL
mmetsp:Transcript_14816/g.46599  ORF Transcript_14816/g.46599 Transcript_14816/m.46599 type:complete len:212 (-) Transcript_14816:1303-1938(-)